MKILTLTLLMYNHGIIVRPLLFTHPEKNALGIYSGCVLICQINK